MAIVATEQPTDLVGSASPACAVPDGRAHALDPGALRTWCGIDANRLTPWPDLAWPPSGMAATDTCPACERGVVEA
jgi:hypothetical protein